MLCNIPQFFVETIFTSKNLRPIQIFVSFLSMVQLSYCKYFTVLAMKLLSLDDIILLAAPQFTGEWEKMSSSWRSKDSMCDFNEDRLPMKIIFMLNILKRFKGILEVQSVKAFVTAARARKHQEVFNLSHQVCGIIQNHQDKSQSVDIIRAGVGSAVQSKNRTLLKMMEELAPAQPSLAQQIEASCIFMGLRSKFEKDGQLRALYENNLQFQFKNQKRKLLAQYLQINKGFNCLILYKFPRSDNSVSSFFDHFSNIKQMPIDMLQLYAFLAFDSGIIQKFNVSEVISQYRKAMQGHPSKCIQRALIILSAFLFRQRQFLHAQGLVNGAQDYSFGIYYLWVSWLKEMILSRRIGNRSEQTSEEQGARLSAIFLGITLQ